MAPEIDPALEAAIGAVPSWSGVPSEGIDVTPITSGITNRNFRVDIGGESFVVRLAGEDTELLGIDRAAEEEAARAAAEAGVGPEVFAFLPEHGCLITRFVAGRSIPEEDLKREEVLSKVVAGVRGIHGCRPIHAAFPVFRIVEDYRAVAASRGVAVPSVYDDAHALADRIEESFAAAPMRETTCHNDLLNANFLLDGDHVWIVDYEYAGMGDPFFDLGNLSINNGLGEAAQEALLRLYFASAVHDAHRARLGLMRIMSDFREAMWGVVQQGLSTLDFDYVAYADNHFARLLESAADDRFEDWLEAAKAAV